LGLLLCSTLWHFTAAALQENTSLPFNKEKKREVAVFVFRAILRRKRINENTMTADAVFISGRNEYVPPVTNPEMPVAESSGWDVAPNIVRLTRHPF
jgi:hypothetical protein